jgi:hypothetical protein
MDDRKIRSHVLRLNGADNFLRVHSEGSAKVTTSYPSVEPLALSSLLDWVGVRSGAPVCESRLLD